jgi:hypothetical protein
VKTFFVPPRIAQGLREVVEMCGKVWKITGMRRAAPVLLAILVGSVCALAEPQGGKTQADGSIRYDSKFGTVVVKPDGEMQLTQPNAKHWAAVRLPGFALDVVQSKKGGVMFTTDATAQGFVASAYFEKVAAKTAVECREFYFSHALESPLPKKDITRFEKDGLAVGAYVTTEFKGKKVDQYHRNIYALADSYCLDLHISKVYFDPVVDEKALDAWTSQVTLVAK